MRYPTAGRDQLARLMAGSGLAAAAAGLGVALATRTVGPFVLALPVTVRLIWLGRTLGTGFVDVGGDNRHRARRMARSASGTLFS